MTKKPRSKRAIFHYIVRLLLSIAAVVVVSCIVWYHFPSSSIQCANTGSCGREFSTKVENNAIAFFDGQKIVPPSINLSVKSIDQGVLGASIASGEKHIYVDLTTQTLYAYQGKTLVMQTLISSGKWNPTPTGEFTIWIKLRATRMKGGEGADAYDLPNVPYVMYFYNDQVPQYLGYSLHGAYWHNNFGHPMSHGCINMRIVDAQKLYDWVNPPTTGFTTYATDQYPGTKVTIGGIAPGQ